MLLPHSYDTLAGSGATWCSHPMEVVVLYDDRQSFYRATHLLRDSVCDLSNATDVCLLPWRFSEIQLDPWQDRALNDVATADFLVISGGTQPIPTAMIEWVAEAFARRADRPSKVMLLLGDGDSRSENAASSSRLVRRIAGFAGVEFVSPEWLALAGSRN